MNTKPASLIDNWKAELKSKRFASSFLVSVFCLAFILYILTSFLDLIESRSGAVMPDPILGYFTAVDLTWVIFAVIYISLVSAIISLIPNPRQLLLAVQLYALMVAVRIAAMFLLPLEPPEGMIMLKDPFVEFFGSGTTLTKDLFFSGHTASILIFYLTADKKAFKNIFLSLTILIGIMVILQKVHYVIDVYAAVFFTIACYFILNRLKIRFNF